MKKELEDKLIEKYKYLFLEKEHSEKVMIEQDKILEEMYKARKDNDKNKQEELKEKSKALGQYQPIAYGLQCGDGWYDLLDELMGKLQEVDVEKKIQIHQIKEKLGGLRFYINDGSVRFDVLGVTSEIVGLTNEWEKIHDIITEYESKSYKICEVCGKEGKLCVNKYWLKTVCSEHRILRTNGGDDAIYMPVKYFRDDEKVIANDIDLTKIINADFDEEKDDWFYTCENGKTFSQDELRRLPHSRFYEGWYVKDKDGIESVVTGKTYDINEGWVYTVATNEQAIIKKEENIEPVYENINGFQHIKRLKE